MQKVAETKKVVRNTRSCQKVAEQLVESPIRLDFFLKGGGAGAGSGGGGGNGGSTIPEQGLEPTVVKFIPRLPVLNGSRVCVTIHSS